MSFTRQELFEYFADRYEAPTVEKALTELAKYDTTVNPQGAEFSDHITEQLESVFEVVVEAFDKQRALTSSLAVDIAEERGITVNPGAVENIVQVFLERGITRGVALHQLEVAATEKTRAQLEFDYLRQQAGLNTQQSEALFRLLNDHGALNKILTEYGIDDFKTANHAKAYQEEITDFDPTAFLAEVSAGKELSKAPVTAKDSKGLVKALVQKYSGR
ncbi:MAG: hypothetical protein KME29_04980 [Calothrix sp. FI2-JRJ7]|jgi:hypothetical protein|nr:hypothetical protein [Calothrix sp. FI2-JRJ7]